MESKQLQTVLGNFVARSVQHSIITSSSIRSCIRLVCKYLTITLSIYIIRKWLTIKSVIHLIKFLVYEIFHRSFFSIWYRSCLTISWLFRIWCLFTPPFNASLATQDRYFFYPLHTNKPCLVNLVWQNENKSKETKGLAFTYRIPARFNLCFHLD